MKDVPDKIVERMHSSSAVFGLAVRETGPGTPRKVSPWRKTHPKPEVEPPETEDHKMIAAIKREQYGNPGFVLADRYKMSSARVGKILANLSFKNVEPKPWPYEFYPNGQRNPDFGKL